MAQRFGLGRIAHPAVGDHLTETFANATLRLRSGARRQFRFLPHKRFRIINYVRTGLAVVLRPDDV